MQIPLITAKQFNSYLLKTASKLALQKIKEVTGYLIENNIAGKVAKSYDDKIARPASQDNLDTGSKPGKKKDNKRKLYIHRKNTVNYLKAKIKIV